MKPALLVRVALDFDRAATISESFTLYDASSADKLAAVIADHAPRIRGVITNGSVGLSREVIDQLPNLEIISAVGVGYEHIDIAAAHERGIAVTHGPGTNSVSVADHALALLLSAAREIPQYNAFVHAGEWAARAAGPGGQWANSRPALPGVFGKKLGLLGLGAIGSGIARRAHLGFEMNIGYHTRNPVPDAPYTWFPDLVSLAGWADYLIVAAPGGPATRGLVNEAVLSALGPNGILVNIARGSIVDNDALIAALHDKRIRAVALDVVDGEPRVPEALLAMPNAILTPHMAARTPEANANMTSLMLRNLLAHFAGEELPTPVRPHASAPARGGTD